MKYPYIENFWKTRCLRLHRENGELHAEIYRLKKEAKCQTVSYNKAYLELNKDCNKWFLERKKWSDKADMQAVLIGKITGAAFFFFGVAFWLVCTK